MQQKLKNVNMKTRLPVNAWSIAKPNATFLIADLGPLNKTIT